MSGEATTVWRVERWRSEPREHTIIKRSAKTLTVVANGYQSRALISDIGTEWFWTELEAYQGQAKRSERAIEHLKGQLQAERSKLGQFESRIKALQA